MTETWVGGTKMTETWVSLSAKKMSDIAWEANKLQLEGYRSAAADKVWGYFDQAMIDGAFKEIAGWIDLFPWKHLHGEVLFTLAFVLCRGKAKIQGWDAWISAVIDHLVEQGADPTDVEDMR